MKPAIFLHFHTTSAFEQAIAILKHRGISFVCDFGEMRTLEVLPDDLAFIQKELSAAQIIDYTIAQPFNTSEFFQ